MNSHSIFCTHSVRLWYVYQHLVAFYGKWKKICHTWIPWGAEYGRILRVFMRDQTLTDWSTIAQIGLITSQVSVVWASQRVLESFINNTFQHVQPEHFFLWWDVSSPIGSSFVHLHLDLISWWVNIPLLWVIIWDQPKLCTIIKGNSLKTTIHLFWSHRKWLPFNEPSKNTPITSLEHLILR